MLCGSSVAPCALGLAELAVVLLAFLLHLVKQWLGLLYPSSSQRFSDSAPGIVLTQQYLLSFAQNLWPRKKEKEGGRKERKDKILHLVVLSSQVVPVGFYFICTGWGKEKKKTRWNSYKAQEMFEPDNKLPLFRGTGEREQKKGTEDQLKPTSALCSWAGFFFLPFIVWGLLYCSVSCDNFICTRAFAYCLLEGGQMKGFLGTHLLFGWEGFVSCSIIYLSLSIIYSCFAWSFSSSHDDQDG